MSDDSLGNDEASQASDLELFEKYLEQGLEMEQPDRGDLRKGIIVEIRSSELVVDIGSKRDGVVPQSDLARLEPGYVKSLETGQEVDVVVVKQSDDEGVIQLSMSDAIQQRDWITAQELLDNGETVVHKVVGFNKGGLTVEFNRLRGFVPASHILDMPRNISEEERQAQFERHVGEDMRLKVIEVDRKRRRLVMSQMLAEREYRAGRKDELFRTLKVGEVLTGEVHSLRPFGAFIDLGGADGLLHVSEIGWTPITHPREALEVGQKIDVQVIRLDPDSQRIALSRKRVMSNPWDTVEDRYEVGMLLPATVTRLVDFGAFAQLEPGVEGLIHISGLADITVAEPLKSVRPGDHVTVKVLRVDGKRQRIGLSLRQAQQGEAVAAAAGDEEAVAEASAEVVEVEEAEVVGAVSEAIVNGELVAAVEVNDVEVAEETEVAEGAADEASGESEPV